MANPNMHDVSEEDEALMKSDGNELLSPPPYTERDPSTESSKDEVNIAAPEAVSPFPKRSEIHLQYQPLAAPQQTMHVVKSQPRMQAANRGTSLNDYLGLSVFTTFCCCLPFGLISLFYSIKVHDAWSQGDVEEAYRYSRRAKYWNIAGIVTGFILGVIVGVVAGVLRFVAL